AERVAEVLAPFALRALTHVFELGELAQVAVLQLVEILLRQLEPRSGLLEGGALLFLEDPFQRLPRVVHLDRPGVVGGLGGRAAAPFLILVLAHRGVPSRSRVSRRSSRSESARPSSSTTGMTRGYSRRAGPMTPSMPESVSPTP